MLARLHAAMKWIARQLLGSPVLNRWLVQWAIEKMFERAKELAKKTETELDDDAVQKVHDFVVLHNLDRELIEELEKLHDVSTR